MGKDLEKELEELLKKCKSIEKEECHEFGPPSYIDTGCGDWILALVALGMLGDKPFLEPKEPIINIYLGGDK